jgi:histidyl-tRNA synthetase
MQAEGIGAEEAPLDAQLVAAGEAERRFGFQLLEQLRTRVPGAKVAVGMPSAGFKAQLRHADKSGARFALIIGESELAAAKVSLKPLREDKPQQLMTVEECAERLRQTRLPA